VGVTGAGIALIIGVDRILDMSRTTVNVTGDQAACVVMNRWLRPSPLRPWSDVLNSRRTPPGTREFLPFPQRSLRKFLDFPHPSRGSRHELGLPPCGRATSGQRRAMSMRNHRDLLRESHW
jgi:hypothetical protein